MTGKCPPPRPHYPILHGDQPVGEVTSGTQSPSLRTGIGMGYASSAAAARGTAIAIEVRGKKFPAVIEQKPLLKKGP
jgi:aminomethyltransferase